MRYVSIMVAFCIICAGILLAEKKKTVKVPKAPQEHAMKKVVKNSVEMALTIRKKQSAGTPIMLEISVINKGQNVVRHGPLDGAYGDFRIKITQPDGKKVPFTRFGKPGWGKKPTRFTKSNPKPIKPGELYSVTLNLSLLFDLTLPWTYRAAVETEIYPPGSPKNSTEFTLKVTDLEFKVSEPRPVIRVRGPATAPARQKKVDTEKK